MWEDFYKEINMIPHGLHASRTTKGEIIAKREDVRVIKHFDDHSGKYRYFLQKKTSDGFFSVGKWQDSANTINDTIYDAWIEHYGMTLV